MNLHAKQMDLCHKNWQFRNAKELNSWHQATIPGSVHTDLMAAGLIPDPFKSDNESKVQWVENEDWIYQCNFNITASQLNENKIELVFEGLDTYAEVELNGKKILSASNMFRIWKVDIKKIIKSGNNQLRILFKSSVQIAKNNYNLLGAKLPNDERVMVRKAQYQFGWDWGPRLVTAGIYKKVYIETWSNLKIIDLHYSLKELKGVNAKMNVEMDLETTSKGNYYISIINKENSIKLKDSLIHLPKGKSKFNLLFDIKQVKLWWCNGLGEPYLYDLEAVIIGADKKFAKESKRIGVKKLEIIQTPDEQGRSFYFRLNGVPVFMKGANYIPQDNFVSRTNKTSSRHLLEQAKLSNMNMIRIWGGGIYEYDEFYDLCDEAGLLVWQDFMYACSMYPGDSIFLDNIKKESIDQVKRLRNHASLAIWCGNNEMSEGWHNWGWQKQFNYSASDSSRIWNDYLKIFHQIIPEVVNEFDQEHFYWPSSPEYGWGRKESLKKGDAHYWGVWWGEEPFSVYENKVGRFMSEYGFQGFPAMNTFFEFTDSLNFHIDSNVIKLHNKHPRGIQTIKTYMERDYIVPNKFEDFAYVSQCLQADGIKIAIEAHRRNMPYCMGTLYWQLNDCWPVISWSGMDYKHRWKALQYQVKRSFEPVLLSFDEKGDSLQLYMVSDLLKQERGELEITLEDFNGNQIYQIKDSILIQKNQSQILKSFLKSNLTKGLNIKNLLFHAEIKTKLNRKIEADFYFVKVKDLELKKQDLDLKLVPQKDYYELEISSKTFHKNIWIECDAELSDNFFDLRANETKVVQIKSNSSIPSLIMDIKSINYLK
jgi:beta-mannosidase